ncbi:uncharacterized protein [Clytia hemisphaerica]|uniref:uncharacterized protein n=1 Tax=Clytia hemisphaerica TaxID=252671 RepID=UPI0034D44BCB
MASSHLHHSSATYPVVPGSQDSATHILNHSAPNMMTSSNRGNYLPEHLPPHNDGYMMPASKRQRFDNQTTAAATTPNMDSTQCHPPTSHMHLSQNIPAQSYPQIHPSLLTPPETHTPYSYCTYGGNGGGPLDEETSQTHGALAVSSYPNMEEVSAAR